MNSTVTSNKKNVAQCVVADKEHKNVKMMKEQKYGCKTHGDAKLMEDHATGDIICTACAFVVEERMITDEAEWRCFDGDTQVEKWSKSRTGDAGNPFLSADFNLGTTIKMLAPKQMASTNNYSSNIVKQYQRRSIDNALQHAFKEIATMGDRLNLPSSVLSKANALYSRLYRRINLKGNKLLVDSKAAACMYIACKEENCSRSVQEIAAIYGTTKSALSAAIRRALNSLEVKIPDSHGIEMIDRYCAHLNITKVERIKAWRIADQIERLEWKTKMLPENIAVTAILLAKISSHGTITGKETQELRTSFSKEISNVTGIVAKQIIKFYNMVKDHLNVNVFYDKP
ncbi:transcription initiation factor IIB-like [Sitodiplosis mosellana]|uniref:transcription initiation factor IIB-like n=1 Tax=Sitodiplosis mosellana TaxID=263140 RepID=UPI0024449B45|nr:transcription initiation factor IIB-like [Sitodiplosis mosellana]